MKEKQRRKKVICIQEVGFIEVSYSIFLLSETKDGVTSLGYRNLNKILRAALCSSFACYLQGLLSWKNLTQF